MPVSRVVALDDISIRSGGDGRTVEGYAAVFNQPAEVHDQDGDYLEQIAPTAFNRSVSERSGRIFSVYNHAKTLHGTPSDLGSVPIGVPVDIRADRKGLFTATKINKGAYGDMILEAVRSGSLRGMSFTGGFVRSEPQLRPGQRYRPDARGNLPLVTRQDIELIEYGPTPIPIYPGAEVVGVRSQDGTVQPPVTTWGPQERIDWLLAHEVREVPVVDRIMRAREAAYLGGRWVPEDHPDLPGEPQSRADEMCPWCGVGQPWMTPAGCAYPVCERCFTGYAADAASRELDALAMRTARARQALTDRQARRSR